RPPASAPRCSRGAGAAGRTAGLCDLLARTGGEWRHRGGFSGAPCRLRPRTRGGGGVRRPAHARRRLSGAPAAPWYRRRVRRAVDASDLMRFRRHIPPVHEWKLPWTLPELSALSARRWALALVGVMLGGYLTAYLVLF